MKGKTSKPDNNMNSYAGKITKIGSSRPLRMDLKPPSLTSLSSPLKGSSPLKKSSPPSSPLLTSTSIPKSSTVSEILTPTTSSTYGADLLGSTDKIPRKIPINCVPIIKSACYDEKEFIERSKEKNELFEEKMGLKNPQFSFPLYPVYHDNPKSDILLKETNNIGLLLFMAVSGPNNGPNNGPNPNNENCKNKTMRYKKDNKDNKDNKITEETKIKDFKLQYGLPYEIINIGTRFDVKECTSPPGKIIEVREIELTKNPLYFATSKERKTSKDNKDNKDNKMKLLSHVIQVPIVSEIPWKQLCVALSERYACDMGKILDHLWIPRNEFDEKVLEILIDPGSKEILKKFNYLRRELNNINNNAYVEAMIYALLSSMTINKLTPLFPRLYDTGRAQDSSTWSTWKQYIITQQTNNYYNDVLVMHSEIDLEMLLAHIFQIVFGLDVAQTNISFIQGNLDIRHAVHYVKIEPPESMPYLFFKWRRRYYKVPTDGVIIKLFGFENSSVVLNGVKHGSDNNNSFNTDLVRLGATLHRVILEKQKKIVCKHKDIHDAFFSMINKWRNCGVNESNKLSKSSSSSATTITTKDIELKEFKMKCLEDEDKNLTCTWKRIAQIPSHTECCDAVPAMQQEFFTIFEVEEDMIDPNTTVYVL